MFVAELIGGTSGAPRAAAATQVARGDEAESGREILLAFWKVHILHHAQERPIYGAWLLEELWRHGLRVSPGTLYPMLARMAQHGWLRPLPQADPDAPPNARREYVLTLKGARTLGALRRQVAELYREVV